MPALYNRLGLNIVFISPSFPVQYKTIHIQSVSVYQLLRSPCDSMQVYGDLIITTL